MMSVHLSRTEGVEGIVYSLTVNLDAEMGAAAFGLGAFVGGPCGCSVHKVVAAPTSSFLSLSITALYQRLLCWTSLGFGLLSSRLYSPN